MNPLLVLLGQQVGVPIAEESLPPVENTILVERNRGTKYSAEDDPALGTRLLGNTLAIEATGQAIQRGQEVSDRRGMFGMKGTLRDVLGVLGDAFLMQSGNAPIYAPTRRKEQISDAMAGYTDKPLEAIERVAYYDPQMAAELKKEYETNLLRQAQQQSLQDTRDSQIEDRNYSRLKDGRAIVQRILAQPGAFGTDGQLSPAAQRLIATAAQNAGTTVEGLIGADMTPEALRLFGEADMTVNQQRNLPIAQQRADASTSQARSSAVRAARPPAGSRPPQITEAQMLYNFMKIPPNQRTPEQQNFIDKKTKPTTRGGRSLRSDPLGTGSAPGRRLGPPRN